MGYYGDGTTRITSNIGKRLEGIKVEVKRLKRDFEDKKEKDNYNSMDKYIIEKGDAILKQCEESLRLIDEIDYIGIITRSMKRNEICLGRVDEGNLRVMEGIEIGSLKNISYNLIEEDIYNYLRKIRRRKKKVNIDKYVDEYIDLSHLTNDSKCYINILLSVPCDTLKQWYRYRYNKRDLSSEEYLKNIKIAMEYEGYPLI